MFQITCDGNVIYDPRDRELTVGSPQLALEVNTAGSASFLLYPDHPRAGSLRKLSSTIEITEGTNTLFRGRLIDDVKSFYNARMMTCEGALAYLNDSVIRPYRFPEDFQHDEDYIDAAENGNVIEFFLGWLIDQHNAQVGQDRQLHLGTVTMTDPNNYISRSSEGYTKTWDVLRDKLFDSSLGGYVYARYESNGTFIDYLSELTEQSVQDVVFGENLLDLEQAINATETYTVVLPLGAKDDDPDSETYEQRLTIAELPDGEITEDLIKDGDQIYSLSGVAAYGRICAPVDETTWDDVSIAINLRSKAAEWLANKAVKLQQTITVKAVDLYFTGEAQEIFLPYTLINVGSTPHSVSDTFALTKITYDIANPANSDLTLGATKRTLTDANVDRQRNTDELIQSTYADIRGNARAINSLAQQVTDQSTSILQSAEQIILSALINYVEKGQFGDGTVPAETLAQYQETISSALSILSDRIEMNFSTVSNSISATDGRVTRNYNELVRYIRFENGNIILGMQGNPMTLHLSRDRVSFLQDNLEVAYFSNQKLFVTSGEFLNSLQLGVFGFVPAQATGALSFKKVK